ncbi:MAG: thiamine phosphate synthase [Cycloclasticus sp. symbiont of Poecilosclerida sp. N]|nr:MAG: thiamine phosphate synthase [Cycloclasticus sp. symbiont of Poecilosclerida sp. N]
MSLPKKGLYVITPNNLEAGELYLKVEQALKGGISLLQYRDKSNPAEEKLQRAKALHQLCIKHQVPLIINDDPELAFACQAEGVHLGQGDGSVSDARELLGEIAIIGVTCHHRPELALQAAKEGADYVALGRFFKSTSKPGESLATAQLITDMKKHIKKPVVAIGGITISNAESLVGAGADYLAVIDSVFSQINIQEYCQRFSRIFNTHKETQN